MAAAQGDGVPLSVPTSLLKSAAKIALDKQQQGGLAALLRRRAPTAESRPTAGRCRQRTPAPLPLHFFHSHSFHPCLPPPVIHHTEAQLRSALQELELARQQEARRLAATTDALRLQHERRMATLERRFLTEAEALQVLQGGWFLGAGLVLETVRT